MKEIIIKADSNDGNYLHGISQITEKDLKLIKPLVTAVKKKGKNWGHNWNTSEYADEERPEEMYSDFPEKVIAVLQDLVPYGEHGVHSIRSITISSIPKRTKLL